MQVKESKWRPSGDREDFLCAAGNRESHPSPMDGTLTKQLDCSKSHPRNPLSKAEVEEEFAALAEGALSEGAEKNLKNAI